MNSVIINGSFIKKWNPRYDETENDEKDYQRILSAVARDIKNLGTLSKEVFTDILNWKTPRLKGFVRLDNYDLYAEAIKKCLILPDDQKLGIIDNLDGIGAPFASTILHFIYPDEFPIMDIRTVEVLYSSGYIKFKSRDAKRYQAFKDAIFLIHKQSPGLTLRQIDRALFAFHKIELNNK